MWLKVIQSSETGNFVELRAQESDVANLNGNNIQKDDNSGLIFESGTSFGLSQMDIEIQHIEYMIEKLRGRRVLTIWKRNQYVPISRLPVEIMAEIFMYGFAMACVAEQDTEATIFPLILGQVCHDWRHIAWQLSELWNKFHCRISNTRCSVQAELLREWLSRSESRLLFIRITVEDENAWATSMMPTDIIDALIPHCRKWRHLNLVLPACWYSNLAQVRGQLDNLSTLYVRPPTNASIPLPLDAFLNAPCLQRLITSYNFLYNLQFPWEQLTKVTMSLASLDEALELLRRCSNMVECRFDDLTVFEEHFPIDVVFHPSIHTLDVSLDPATFIDHLFMFLVLPDLSALNLRLSETHHNPVPAIESLIERSDASLKWVCINGPRIPEQDIIDFLKYNDYATHITTNPSIMAKPRIQNT